MSFGKYKLCTILLTFKFCIICHTNHVFKSLIALLVICVFYFNEKGISRGPVIPFSVNHLLRTCSRNVKLHNCYFSSSTRTTRHFQPTVLCTTFSQFNWTHTRFPLLELSSNFHSIWTFRKLTLYVPSFEELNHCKEISMLCLPLGTFYTMLKQNYANMHVLQTLVMFFVWVVNLFSKLLAQTAER